MNSNVFKKLLNLDSVLLSGNKCIQKDFITSVEVRTLDKNLSCFFCEVIPKKFSDSELEQFNKATDSIEFSLPENCDTTNTILSLENDVNVLKQNTSDLIATIKKIQSEDAKCQNDVTAKSTAADQAEISNDKCKNDKKTIAKELNDLKQEVEVVCAKEFDRYATNTLKSDQNNLLRSVEGIESDMNDLKTTVETIQKDQKVQRDSKIKTHVEDAIKGSFTKKLVQIMSKIDEIVAQHDTFMDKTAELKRCKSGCEEDVN